jgi:hypothetical protein
MLKNWKVSLAVTYNPLMSAFGYIYRGHDFGWQQLGQSTSWSTIPSIPQQISKDLEDANKVFILYKTLLGQSTALLVTTTESRQAMSYAFGPAPN